MMTTPGKEVFKMSDSKSPGDANESMQVSEFLRGSQADAGASMEVNAGNRGRAEDIPIE